LFRERGFDATTLRAIAARAGMGASSIYRHIRSKEELLVEELAELQERAWTRFRASGSQGLTGRERVRKFLDMEHELMAGDPDLTTIALRATTHPEHRASRRVLALQDRTIGLVTEILQGARTRGELRRDVDPLVAARAITHITSGARIAWANGLLSADACRAAIDSGVDLLFRGLERPG
jgi:AcrR family transcriptional regulator